MSKATHWAIGSATQNSETVEWLGRVNEVEWRNG